MELAKADFVEKSVVRKIPVVYNDFMGRQAGNGRKYKGKGISQWTLTKSSMRF